MKFYLAGRYQDKETIGSFAKSLSKIGHEITATWMYEPYDPNILQSQLSLQENRICGIKDLKEISECEELIFFSENEITPTPRNGRHVEFGYALALGKRINVIGPRENIFHYLTQIHLYETKDEFVEHLFVRSMYGNLLV